MGQKEEKVKVVLDTNVLVSALLFRKGVSRIADLWKTRVIVPVFSKETFEELQRVLEYAKFSLTKEEISSIIYEEVLPYFEITKVEGQKEGICRDPDDEKFISCALYSGAKFLVSGDPDLCQLKSYQNFRIIKPSEFLKLFDKS